MTSTPSGDRRVNILIVDDKPANVCSLEAILTDPSYRLVCVNSGLEALRCTLNQDFAVILLDVMMPEMDGFEVARLVRQRGRNGVIPIIFLTAIATDLRYMQAGYAAGAVDYLQKPLDPEMLRSKVAVFVELYRRNEMIRHQEAQLRDLQRIEQERRFDDMRRTSERHFRKLAESLPQIIFTANADGSIRYLNRPVSCPGEQVTPEKGSEPCLETAIHGLIHPKDLGAYLDHWRQALATGEGAALELRLEDRTTGHYRWHLCQTLPELSPLNELVGWFGTFTDIDLQKRREEGQRLLAEAGSCLGATQDYAHNIQRLVQRITADYADLCIVDLVLPAKGFQRLLAASEGSPAALEGVLRQAVNPDEARRLAAPALDDRRPLLIEDLLAEGARFHPAFGQFLYEEHGHRPSLISAPILLRGEFAGALSLVRLCDHDPFSRTELDLVSEICRHVSLSLDNCLLFEEVRDNDRLKDEFLAILSHELRTPLNSILGWTELIRMETTEPVVIEGLGVIERSAHNLTHLVNDLLDVSRIVSGKLEINKQPVDLLNFLRNVVSTLQPFADGKEVTLVFEEPGRLPKIEGDPGRLEQVIWNLLNNAIKFTPKGGEVRLSARYVDDQVEFAVADTGIGIRSELLPFVFDRFRQADSSSTRRHGGLGLGLSIVKHLVQLHNGSVTVASAGIGLGATFKVSLPVSHRLGWPAKGASPAFEPGLERRLEGIEILLVDDDPITRLLAEKQLARSGATVTVAGSVREALEVVHRQLPDVVITDIGMPEHDGFHLLRTIRSLEGSLGRRLPIAAYSAYASEEDAQWALEAGFDSYITKPVSAARLIKAVLQLAEGSTLSALRQQAADRSADHSMDL